MGFNVNCYDCEYCRIYAGIDDYEECYVCAVNAPILIEVDVINNRDCCNFKSKRV